jgi:mono/diheme cytochrome c family protein
MPVRLPRRSREEKGMLSGMSKAVLWAGAALVLLSLSGLAAHAAEPVSAAIARGKYLVTLGGCTDCHTPGSLMGHPDMAKFLGGSDVGFAIPGQGVFVGSNLTPDPETGLGKWTTEQIVTTLTTGVRPDGRILAPIMPWRAFSHLTHSDALAIAAYLKSLPPVHREVAGPFGPKETPTVFVMTVVPADVYSRLPQLGAPPQ